MKFSEAFEELRAWKKIRRTDWRPGFYWHRVNDEILQHSGWTGGEKRLGHAIDCDVAMLKDDWEIVEDEPETHSFSWAIEQVKAGKRVTRKCWNSKGQYIELGANFTYIGPAGEGHDLGEPSYHEDIGSRAIVNCGPSWRQVGWLASQADMLAEDWVLADV